MNQQIALYGGSFDPLHIGHITVIEKALAKLDIDKLIIVPNFQNPFKNGTHATAELRLQWLKKSFANNPNIEISSFEIEKNRAVSSYETVNFFITQYQKIYFIIGADNLKNLNNWHNFRELDKRVTWVVATRDNLKIPKSYIQLKVDLSVSSTQIREKPSLYEHPDNLSAEIIDFYINNKKERELMSTNTPTLAERIENISNVLDKNKAENIEVFDLHETDYMSDAVVIASSLSLRHTEALLEYLKKDLKPAEQFLATDISDEWIVADLGDILIHIMTPEYRNRYDIESFLAETQKRVSEED